MKMCGIDNYDDSRHFDFPMKSIRYVCVEKSQNPERDDMFYLKAVGFRDRIRITEQTYREVLDWLKDYQPK